MSSEAGGAPAVAAQRSDDLRGGLLMLASGLLFSISSAAVKELATDLPVFVVAALRHAFALVWFVPLIARRGPAYFTTRRYFSHLYRGAFGFVSFLAFIYVLPLLNLADVIALSFTTPLWSLLLTVLFLGERVPPARWLATAVGFAGVILIAKPSSAVGLASTIALSSALLSSLAMMKVKQLSLTEPPDRIAFYFMLNGLLMGLPLALPVWRTPEPRQWLLLALMGGLSFAGQICLSRAYAIGTFSKMAPMDFFRLPLGILVGFVLFGELPDAFSVLGMAIVVAASLFILMSRAAPRAS
ncbi:MAG TPA: DMT family transporter [Candidatus Sulfotelmatobacter sp.]|nr:DMT family transporter [Candidatus Sulfotelmatobacter sp.]